MKSISELRRTAAGRQPANIGGAPAPRQNPSDPAIPPPGRHDAARSAAPSAALAAIYATRMLGLFLLLPVLALYARSAARLLARRCSGLAMGAYGLTQAVLQIPFGSWSDRIGRKPLITMGLVLFAVGSLVGALAHTVAMLALARGIQGAGAVSAAVTALLADLTRTEVRTRAMAVIGISIGLSFVVALIVAPVLDAAFRRAGHLRASCSCWRCSGIAAAAPRGSGRAGNGPAGPKAAKLSRPARRSSGRPQLRPLYLGIFALHFDHDGHVHLGAAGPRDDLGIPSAEHWKVYLGVFVVSIAGTVPLVLRTERSASAGPLFIWRSLLLGRGAGAARRRPRPPVDRAGSADAVLCGVQLPRSPPAGPADPSAPAADRGAALGVFATAQFLGVRSSAASSGGAAGPIRHLRASSGAAPSWRSSGPAAAGRAWPRRRSFQAEPGRFAAYAATPRLP